jgi:hypothetical protein
MIRLVRFILNPEPPGTDLRRIRIEIDGRERDFMIAGTPGNLFSVRTETRTDGSRAWSASFLRLPPSMSIT